MMDLLTASDLKARIGVSHTDHDTVIASLVLNVSAQIATYLQRELQIGAAGSVTEYFNVREGQKVFFLRAYPNVVVASVWNDPDWVFGSGDLVETSAYRADADNGILYFDTGYLVTGFQALKVSYKGGVAANTAALLTSDTGRTIHEAAVRQAAYLFNTRKEIGAVSVSAGAGGNVSWTQAEGLLPEVQDLLRPLRRRQ